MTPFASLSTTRRATGSVVVETGVPSLFYANSPVETTETTPLFLKIPQTPLSPLLHFLTPHGFVDISIHKLRSFKTYCANKQKSNKRFLHQTVLYLLHLKQCVSVGLLLAYDTGSRSEIHVLTSFNTFSATSGRSWCRAWYPPS